MASPNRNADAVVLTIPMRAEYVSIARLTAAGVANRAGFDIETIEDIKVSLSEVCNRIINAQYNYDCESDFECKIEFVISSDSLEIDFYINRAEELAALISGDASFDIGGDMISIDDDGTIDEDRAKEYEEQLQLSLITLLMDEFNINPNDHCLVSMKKYLE